MGIIDTNNYTIKCDSCGALGHAKVHDKGNRFSGSDWQARGNFEGFESVWQQDDSGAEPKFISATCKKCGGTASIVKAHYTQ